MNEETDIPVPVSSSVAEQEKRMETRKAFLLLKTTRRCVPIYAVCLQELYVV